MIEKPQIKLTEIERQKPHVNKIIDERRLLQKISMTFSIPLKNNLKNAFQAAGNSTNIRSGINKQLY